LHPRILSSPILFILSCLFFSRGFNDWNEIAAKYPPWAGGLNESTVLAIAKAMVDTGLKDAGYQYLNLGKEITIPTPLRCSCTCKFACLLCCSSRGHFAEIELVILTGSRYRVGYRMTTILHTKPMSITVVWSEFVT